MKAELINRPHPSTTAAVGGWALRQLVEESSQRWFKRLQWGNQSATNTDASRPQTRRFTVTCRGLRRFPPFTSLSTWKWRSSVQSQWEGVHVSPPRSVKHVHSVCSLWAASSSLRLHIMVHLAHVPHDDRWNCPSPRQEYKAAFVLLNDKGSKHLKRLLGNKRRDCRSN